MTLAKSFEISMTFCALLFSCLLLPGTANAQSSKPVFGMAVFLSSHYGAEIESGQIDTAISALESELAPSDATYIRSNNLCVAYIKARNLAKATSACDEAVLQVQKASEAQAAEKYTPREKRISLREDMAVALSNQGVVLALNGDTEQAENLFRKSIELVRRNKMVQTNLKRLNYAPYGNNVQASNR